MSETEELPTWAGRALQTGNQPEPVAPKRQRPARRGWRRFFIVLIGLAVLAAAGYAGYWFADRESDDSVATDAATTTAPVEADEGSGVATEDTAQATTTSSAVPSTTTTVEQPESPAEDYVSTDPLFDERVEANTRYAVLRQGQLTLYGYVPDAELGNRIQQIAAAVVGPDNVINEYLIDPDTPAVPEAPVFVEDKVLFAFNSVEIEPDFIPILELGTTLMNNVPTVTITLIARTDAAGSEEVNMDVSRRRAQAVIDYWVSQGIDASRITADPRGEEEASEDDDEVTAALRRSVEFRLSGVLGEPPG